MAPEHSPSKMREMRVFISSTFRDMQQEREELNKRIVPRIRKICEERRVSFADVDLRWGITDEEKSEGKVLPICLQEIENCRPFFIGIPGERYGWVPYDIAPDLVQKEPWLASHQHASVTELEILHGVLNQPRMAERSFFYLREKSYTDQLPEEMKKHFVEGPDEEEISRFGIAEVSRRSADRTSRESSQARGMMIVVAEIGETFGRHPGCERGIPTRTKPRI